MRKIWILGVTKVDIDIVNLPPKTKKKNKKKLDFQIRKHKTQYNSTTSPNNSKHNKYTCIYLTCG